MMTVAQPRKKTSRLQRLWDKVRRKERRRNRAANRESELNARIAEQDELIAGLNRRVDEIEGRIPAINDRVYWGIPDPLPVDGSLRRFYKESPSVTDLRQDDWLSSATAKALAEYFLIRPPHSLVSAHARAVMYHLIAARRPARALEIGTYKAGTAEVIVRAMNEVNSGFLFTIDPFGADRVPLMIARWPQQLQKRVRFFAIDSGLFLAQAINDGVHFDFVFIDGNHEFEFAYFDLAATARVAGPGAVVVVDNVSQQGPRRAVRKFLDDNPDWSRLIASEPYPETDFAIVCGPEHILVTDEARSFGQKRYLQGEVRTVELDVARPTAGTGQMEVYCRTFWSGETDELAARREFRVNGIGKVRVDLPTPLVSGVRPEPGNIFRIETLVSFRPDPGREPLRLRSAPTVYPATPAPLV